MKREITISEALTILVVLVMSLVGWGVSVEVRLATHKAEIETVLRMAEKVDDMHELLIRHDVKLEKPLTRGNDGFLKIKSAH